MANDLESFFNGTSQTNQNRDVKAGEPLRADVWNGNFYTLSKGLADLVNAVRQNNTEYTWDNLDNWTTQLKTDLQYINPQYIDISEEDGSQLYIEYEDKENKKTPQIKSLDSTQNKTLTISDGALSYNNTSTNYTIKAGKLSDDTDGIEISENDSVKYTTEEGKETTIQTQADLDKLFNKYFSVGQNNTNNFVFHSDNFKLNSKTKNDFKKLVDDANNHIINCSIKYRSSNNAMQSMQVVWNSTDTDISIIAYSAVNNSTFITTLNLNDIMDNQSVVLFITYITTN